MQYILSYFLIRMEEKTEKEENRKILIPLPAYLDDAIEEAVRTDSHISKSELVRDAVRRLLEEKGFLK